MENISLDELKKIELDILIYIDEVCKENNLNYSLCGGTLLGAVRHKGFIPWDDDIDIMMPRPDYERFLEIVNGAKGRYKALYSNQKDYYYTFAKIVDSETVLNEYRYQPIENMGVCVDIFPLEGMPSDRVAREEHFNDLDKLRKRINSFSFLKPKIRKNLITYVKTLYLYQINKKANLSEFQKKYEALAKKYNFYDSEYAYASGGAYGKTDIFHMSLVTGHEEIIFENRKFVAIKEIDPFLAQVYGDYMKLPPKEKQVAHHSFTAYYK